MTKHPDLFAALAAPFEPDEIKIRSQSGKQLQYVTARTVMNRLDNVLGPENWWDEYVPSENSVLCRLTVRLPDGSTLTKADAGGYAGLADEGDDDKSGYSDAFKRAAVKFGVARYLYRDGVPAFAVEDRSDKFVASGGDLVYTPAPKASTNGHAKETHDWSEHGYPPANGTAPAAVKEPKAAKAPSTGKGLYAWVRDQETKYEVGLLRYLNSWAKLQEFPGRMVNWNAEQVRLAYAEACRKLANTDDESSA